MVENKIIYIYSVTLYLKIFKTTGEIELKKDCEFYPSPQTKILFPSSLAWWSFEPHSHPAILLNPLPSATTLKPNLLKKTQRNKHCWAGI
jgi:hypothetical protein